MLSFVQNWFAPKTNPVGIDFGSDSLRLAQVQFDGREHKLFAAVSCDVPAQLQTDFEARLDFFSEAVRDLMSQGNFRGRQVVLAVPAAMMHVRHLRVAKADESKLAKIIRHECRGKLPIDPEAAIMRHLIAGEVTVNGQPMLDVILIAAAREAINKYLAAAAHAKLDVVSMNVEPVAIVDCFSHVHRRESDAETVSLYVDLGGCGTRATIAQGTHICWARSINVGGNHFNQAVANAMNVSEDDARLLRLKLSIAESEQADRRDKRNVSAPTPVTKAVIEEFGRPVEMACADVTARLVAALTTCRAEHDAAFADKPVQRLIFVGGEARHRSLCLHIAREMGLTAQVGDPLVHMARASEFSIETGIDRRQPQPSWAVPIGLSFGGPRMTRAHKSRNAARRAAAGATR